MTEMNIRRDGNLTVGNEKRAIDGIRTRDIEKPSCSYEGIQERKKICEDQMLEEYIGELLNEIQENMLSQARNFVQKIPIAYRTVKELYEIMEHKKGL